MKKITILVMIALFACGSLYAQDAAFSNKLITQYTKAQAASLQKDAGIQNHLWLTPILQQALGNWNKLTPEAQQLFGPFRSRPVIPSEVTFELDNFRFHYSVSSGDPDIDVDATDSDMNGTPDYIDNMADIFANMIAYDDHTTMGLTIPPPDGTAGGNALYDVYVSAAEAGAGVYGYVAAEDSIGNNPNSSGITETKAWTSYMVMRSNYSGFTGGEDTCISVTASHEYFHAIQNGYNQEMGIWLMEMTAAWSEDYNFPGYDDNFQYLMGIYSTPDIALNLNDNDDPDGLGNHWYASWIFFKYLTEQTEDAITKAIFERVITTTDIDAIDAELQANWSSDMYNMFDQFAVANAIMDSAAAYDPYIYWRALEYDNYISNNGGLNIEDNLTWSGSLFTWNNSTDGNGRLMRLGVDYIEITPSQDFSVVLIPVNTSAELDIVIIKQNTSTELLDVVYSTQVGNNFVVNVTNTGDYDRFIAVVERFDFAVEDTTSEEYTLAFGSPTGISETSNPGFSVYPNPAKENVNVVFPTNNCKSITITDLLGNVIMSSEANSAMGKMSIDTREITSGMYFLTVCDTDNKVSTQKINIIH